MSSNTFLGFAFLAINFVSGAKYEVTFMDADNLRGDNIDLTYEGNECVNVPPNWQKRIISVNIHDHCIRVYTQLKCQGSPTYLHRGYQDYNHLSAFNLEKKIASFRQCESNIQFQLDVRPRYGMSVQDKPFESGNNYVVDVVSGECYTFPDEWQNRVVSVTIPNYRCWVFYDGTECKGKKRYMKHLSPSHANLKEYNFDKVIKSIKSCSLEFQGECDPAPCPKYLYANSREYEFWKLFFSIYSTRYLNQFEQRVNKSTDGLISWDFLFTPGTAAPSKGDQYSDAFEVLNLILFNLIESPPGKLKFDIAETEKLADLTKLVLDERIDQARKYPWDWTDQNFVFIKHMEEVWKVTDRILGKLNNVWNAEIEQIYGKIQHEVTFTDDDNMQGNNIQLKYKSNECKNLPSNWQKRIISVNIHNHCIRVYTQLDCKGSPAYLHRGYQDYNHLSAFTNLEKNIASFKQCEPNLQFKFNARPRYGMSVQDGIYESGINNVIDVVSGQCYTLPKEWQNRIVSVTIPNFRGWVFYEGTKCTGKKRYMNHFSPSHANLKEYNFDKVIKSIKVTSLEFQGECTPEPCPKYLHRSSVEYAFWRFYFSIYSRPYKSLFEERVKQSKDGMISWDFLFAPNTSAVARGDQYLDAFEHLQLVFFNLVESQPGKLGFNTDDIDTLSDLVKTVLEERKQQSKTYKGDWTQQNIAVILQMELLWSVIDRILGTVSLYWKPERNDDICGLVEPRESLLGSIPLISEGTDAYYGEDPWHAAIYRGESKTLICGATIISPSVLISAAHCFFSEAQEKALNYTSDYEIYVAKFTRTYSKRDSGGNNFQKIHKIRELIFSPNGYNPILTKSYGSDIILIILEEPLKFNKFVRPACIDWDGSIFDDSYDSQNNLGRVVGWGITTNGGIPDARDASENLLMARLPYISFSNCVGKVNHITNDKFCGGAETGASVQQGDSGGGFVFKYKGRFYLRGIVSTRDRESDTSISAFTNVAYYTTWMQKYV